MEKVQLLNEAFNYFKSVNSSSISVLDIGCGQGLYWKDVRSTVKISEVTGVDIQSDEELRVSWSERSFIQTLREIKDLSEPAILNFEFVQSDIAEFVKGTMLKFDLIICFQILSLIEKNSARKLLFNLQGLLNKTGLIVLCIPNEEFEIHTVIGVPNFVMNKFNLREVEFEEFVNDYEIIRYYNENLYHWALLSCRQQQPMHNTA